MKKSTLAFISIVYFSAVSPLMAAPFYFGVGYGQTNFDSIDLQYDSPSADVSDDQDVSTKVFFGQYLSPNFSYEIAYADLGEYTASSAGNYDVKIELKAITADLMAHQHVHTNWDFFAKLGVAYWTTTLNYNDFTNSGSADESKWGPHIGLGFNYKINDQWLLGVEWEQYQNVGQDTNVTLPGSALELNGNDLDVLGVRLTYRLRLAPGP